MGHLQHLPAVDVYPGTYPTMPNAWSRTKQGYSYISLRITRETIGTLRRRSTTGTGSCTSTASSFLFKDAFRAGDEFQWIGVAFQQLFNDWTSSTVTKFGIEEIPATEQEPTPALPYAPIHVEAWASGRDGCMSGGTRRGGESGFRTQRATSSSGRSPTTAGATAPPCPRGRSGADGRGSRRWTD